MKYLGCTVNAQTGMENTYTITPAQSKKKVLIIGGGPAGLEAARIAAQRGLDVTLWEKAKVLGGKLTIAAVPSFKKDLIPFLDYMKREMDRPNITVELGKQATPEDIEAFGADEVIIATGSRFSPPPIPGIDGDNVFSSAELFADQPDTGECVIVIGAGLCGSEAAAELAVNGGKKVTLVEMTDQVVPEGTNLPTLIGIQTLLAQGQVDIRLDTKVVEINATGIVVEKAGEREVIAGDSVIMATGYVADPSLRDATESRVASCKAVGDCVKPGKFIGAIWGGFNAARVID
jgi:2-enoate reductase